MQLRDALAYHADVAIFAVVDSDADDESQWIVEPINANVLTESDEYDVFLVRGKNILPDGGIVDCYIDICLPERISDCVYFLRSDCVDVCHHHECDGDIISAVPIDLYGNYELFYSKTAPDIGIEILRQGLQDSPQKGYIAEDLGYILRDERRFPEAAEMFQISVDEGPSSYFIFGELAACFEEMGDTDRAAKYRRMFEREE
ncbi:tetratricopeptide repeat protein [Planctopirus hydrillae]|uniref:Tetratricopeptide repeat protein n=1 Tax=Planctopirus hydrillae TaxID=1841610 RepID=A0A1C3ETQ3_9PLAN|nr:hypothetical protein [Planctopirus hydrillae]ODA36717.1 hypothetical protein A6X21_15340 [Planctopirus hydrillae]